MAKTIQFTPALGAQYKKLWETLEIDPGQEANVKRVAEAILKNKPRYQAIASQVGSVPWWFIGPIHNLESGRRFDRHLHNGDPLTARTRLVPAGRPASGTPPFSFEESAVDALRLKGLHLIKDWSIERVLYEAERYNGFGYRLYHPSDLSPYLWSKTNHNDGTGKYVADGKWSSTAPSEQQVGFAAALKVMAELDPTIFEDNIPKVEPKPKPLTKTKTIWGAILSALGIGGEEATRVAVEFGKGAEQLQPIIDYAPFVKGLFVALTIGGIALTIYGRWKVRKDHNV
jgi:lysozyme family protein